MDCFQPTGSFKIRGIGRLCQELVQSGKTHLVSSSGGNAGYAAAYAARKLGVDITVFVPQTTSALSRHRIESEGARVTIQGAAWNESDIAARAFAAEVDGGYVPPFDHPTIWAGHATMVDEIVAQCQKPDAIVVAVGGGGLLCGIVEGLHRQGWADVPILAVETSGAASLAESIKAGLRVTLPAITTIATSLGATCVASKAFEWTQSHKIIPVVVSDHSAITACQKFADDHRVLVEPACGAALSVAYENHHSISDGQSILVIVCGGISYLRTSRL